MTGRDAQRGLYAPEEMTRLITPRSVAVVGVSERPNAFGSRTVANMKSFDGQLYQINAKHSELAGRPCYPNIAALPQTPDCVVIATPRESVEPIARECAARGVGAILVYAAGFAETGKPEHVALQQRLLAIAREANMRMVGPNTIGLVNYAIGAGLTFSAMPDRRPLQPHAIGIASQSGSLGFSLAQAVERGVSVSHVLTAGNSCDVDVADQVAYLAQDRQCRAIACLFEGMVDPSRMLPLPQPGPEAAAVLAREVPEYGSTRNPCDVTAQVIGSSAVLGACAGALLADPRYGVMVTSHAYAYELATSRLPVFSQAAATSGKIVCNVWAPEWLGGPGAFETESDPHLALFHSMDRCFAAIAAWNWRAMQRQAARGAWCRISDAGAKPAMEALLAASLTASLTEREAKQVMALYGIPVVADALVQSASAACEAAAKVGFPVVLKGESPDVLHKTEAGLVKLGLRTAPEVERAFNDIERAVAAMSPRPDFRGVVVQPMIPKGVEVMVGARHDPQFGPLVVVGLGGVLVEVLRDTALSLAPVGPSEAEAMLRGLKGSAVLNGFHSAPAVDVPRLAEIVCRFSELAADAGGDVSEMEINPLICAGDRIVAADALIVKGEAR